MIHLSYHRVMKAKRNSNICGLDRASLTAAGVVRSLTAADARRIANERMCAVLIPSEGGRYFEAVPDGYGPCGVRTGSVECAEAELIALGWIVEVARVGGMV